ncbi:MAG: type IV secretory system conjugative DNA transfer family protein [Pseudomonadota bacterium]
MYRSEVPQSVAVEAQIHEARADGSGGFRGILGELQNAVAPLSDPLLRASVSPPFDVGFDGFCQSGQPVQAYLMCPAEMVAPWSPFLKSIFTGAMLAKSRAPSAPRQTWILDEAARLAAQGFDLVEQLFSYGAGLGIRPWVVLQALHQLDTFGGKAKEIIPASAAVQSYFAQRSWEGARHVSDLGGAETLDYVDPAAEVRAALIARQLMAGMPGAKNPFAAAFRLDQALADLHYPGQQQRALRTPDEVLNLGGDEQLIFADGLPGPVLAQRKPYWTQRCMAGRYLPNPYHPPADSVEIMTRWGRRRRRVVTARVPPEYADYPQYRDGLWSYVEM